MPEPEQNVADAGDLRRQLSWLDAAAIYVGIILGSGIFVAPAAVAAAAGTWWMAAGLWIVGGIIAACGACCYAECGARLPRTGGFYIYYREAYGEPLAFIGGWAALLITYPASLAAIALIFGRYLAEIVPEASDDSIKWYAAAALLLAALLNGVGVKAGAGMQRVLTTFKVVALALLCLAALVAPAAATGDAPVIDVGELHPSAFGAVLMAMVILLWTYDGWSDVTLVSGELKSPGRDLGRTVMVGTLLLVALYVLVQVAVMLLLTPEGAASSKRVVADAVAGGLGERWGHAVALLVVVSTFGSLNGIVLTASRLGFAMARDGVFFRWFGVVEPRLGTPARSLGVLIIVSLVYVFVTEFGDLLAIFSFNVWIFYALAAVALLILRRRQVGEPPTWKAPGGIAAPVVVLITAAVMTVSLFSMDPLRALTGLGMLAAGVPVYFVWRMTRKR